MAFINDMKGKISQASYNAAQKAKELSEIAKLNSEIADAENRITELYQDIGYEVYRAYHMKPLPEVVDLLKHVQELHQKIDRCKLQIKAINAINCCPQCGMKVNKDMAFCSGCGYKLPVEEHPALNAPMAYCSDCGEPISFDAIYCTACGKKVR